AFVEYMNREAQILGATHTVYQNVTGLHDPSMVTTVRDTALVAREALNDSLFMSMASAHVHTIPATNASAERTMTNRNALISDTGGQYYNGWCRGINAGMTDEGGWCVITLWEKNGVSNLSVVMKCADVAVGESIPAYTYTNRLLNWAGRAYGYRTVLTADRKIDTLPVAMTGTSKSKTDVFIPVDLKAYLPTHVELSGNVTVTYYLDGDRLQAPLFEGQVVGHVTATYNGNVVATSPLVVMESFSRNGFLKMLTDFRQYLSGRSFIIAAVIFIVLLAGYLKYTTGPGGRYTTRNTRRKPVRADRRFRIRRYRRKPVLGKKQHKK
ncbi:MAG: D-alanyl-D-alanine carboxypeptidase, partial [Ruminococcaceae bacterium]|nr:D-alanyl-D-alanine carboxypeptidase [Oscillospiraceae bacterium]